MDELQLRECVIERLNASQMKLEHCLETVRGTHHYHDHDHLYLLHCTQLHFIEYLANLDPSAESERAIVKELLDAATEPSTTEQ